MSAAAPSRRRRERRAGRERRYAERAPLHAVERKPVLVRTSDGLTLTFWWWDQSAVRERLLIVAPGFAQHHGTNIMRHLARLFSDRSDVLGVDFRGMADNPGRYGFGRQEQLDLRAAFAWAKAMRYKRVELVGFSMGAYISLRALAEDPGPVRRFYFVSGPTDVEDVARTLGPLRQLLYIALRPGHLRLRVWAGSQWFFRWAWPLGGHPSGSDLARRLRLPSHFLIGSEDQLVLPRLTQAVFEATASREKSLTVFAGGQHAEYMAVTQPGKFLRWMREHGFKD